MAELRLLLELLRLTCGVAELLRLGLELLRLTVGAVELEERETAADWLLLLVLPPVERLRPWAEASDAPMIRHPMSAKLIMIFVTEVFIIVLFYIVQQCDLKFVFVCLLDGKPDTKFNHFMHNKPDNLPIRHKVATNRPIS